MQRGRLSRQPASVLTVDELAREFHVSTKTVSRWRLAGLVSRRFLVGGRMRLGFLQSSVDRFTVENEKRIRRAAEFSQLTHEERERIIERARSGPGGRSPYGCRQAHCPRDRP